MKSYFTSDFFAGNRRKLQELFTGTAPIVITANGLLQRGGDSAYPFAQDASFWYLTGIDEPDIVLVMDRDSEYLIVPARSENRQTFDGTIADEVLTQRSGIQTVYDDKTGWELLGTRLKKVKHAATIATAPAYIEAYGLYTNPARAALLQRIKDQNEALELLDLSTHLGRMRMIKQPPELAAIQQAIDITLDSLKDALRPAQLRKHSHEYQLEAQIAQGFRSRGAAGHAFPPIVASGERACTLHYIENNHPVAADELVVVDVGAEVEHYAADITRTIAVGRPSPRQQAIRAAVLAVQQFAIGLLKPGVSLKEYEAQVVEFMGEKLIELGLIKTNNHQEVRKFFPHAASHFLGLNVHDIGDYDRPLEPGVVLTVEPGVYVSDEGIGVRIEDNVLITDDGNRVLSAKLSRELG